LDEVNKWNYTLASFPALQKLSLVFLEATIYSPGLQLDPFLWGMHWYNYGRLRRLEWPKEKNPTVTQAVTLEIS
jgi:hypothetical protein